MDDDKANGFGSNPPEYTFFTLKKERKAIHVNDEKNYQMIGVIKRGFFNVHIFSTPLHITFLC